MPRTTLFAVLLALLAALGLAGCSTPEPASASTLDVAAAVVIDVRTPEEYATGHLEGALLLDITAGELEAALPRLDPAATYLVYCRSGNRAGAAVELMRAAGFTDVTNLGSVDDAARATGLAVGR